MALPTLPVSNVVNVQIQMSPTAAPLRNFGATLIVGTSGVITPQTRIRTYASTELDQIATDFGSSSREYLAAVAFFSQSPQPTEVQIGRWCNEATSGLLQGRILATGEQAMTKFTSIASGAFDVTIDGEVVNVTGVNLASQSNLNGVASQVTAALDSKGTCTWDGQRFVITSATTGTSSTVATVTSTELSQAMGLDEGTSNESGVAAETLSDCINVLLDFPSWYMMAFVADAEDDDLVSAAQIIEAATPSRIFALTTQNTAELDPSQTSSLGYKLHAAELQRTLILYSSASPVAVASVLGRMATVDFSGSNTTITLKFKQLPGITAENLRYSQSQALTGNCVNVFAAYDNDTSILQEGVMSGGWFIDERHGLDWLQNYVQTAVWNLLYGAGKVGQDETGMNELVTTVSQALEQAVTNNLVSPGVWNSSGFGALERGDTLSTGYYVYIQPLEEQSQAEREARQAPPIQSAIKLTGAVHFADVMINVNR